MSPKCENNTKILNIIKLTFSFSHIWKCPFECVKKQTKVGWIENSHSNNVNCNEQEKRKWGNFNEMWFYKLNHWINANK